MLHRRDAEHLLEGTVETGRVLETAAVGDVLDRQSGFGFQQVPCPLHLDLQHLGGGRVACDGHDLPVELTRTHAEFLRHYGNPIRTVRP